MRAIVRATFARFSALLESYCTWMYPDVLGLVTVGEGDLVDSVAAVQALDWQRPDGTVASPAEVEAAFWAVKNSGLGRLGGAAAAVRALTTIRLTHAGVDALVEEKLLENDRALAAYFTSARGTDWEFLNAYGQLGCHSLAWACGCAAITQPGLHHFPKVAAALAAKRYDVCAVECFMPPAANPGNNLTARNSANRALFLKAAEVDAVGGCPDDLVWPLPNAPTA